MTDTTTRPTATPPAGTGPEPSVPGLGRPGPKPSVPGLGRTSNLEGAVLRRLRRAIDGALGLMPRLQLVFVTLGQWCFGLYIATYYGASALVGDFEAWNAGLDHGYRPGDWWGNGAVAGHLLFAIVVVALGPLQLSERLRRRAPRFHRWSGRIYVASVAAASAAGLFMLWGRGVHYGTLEASALSVDAVLILWFSVAAVRAARFQRFRAHKRWALRLFIAASAVWTARVGFMAWMMTTGGAGVDTETLEGPFVDFIVIGQYLLPLAVLELYFWGQRSGSLILRGTIALILLALTTLLAVGVVGAVTALWLPVLD